MKKTKKKKGFFYKIGHFFDKKIITPTTRLIVKFTDRFGGSEKSLEGWLSKTNTLLFVSLILALIVFIVIDQKIIVFTNKTAEVLKNQPVEAVYNEEAYVVEGLPDKVDITLMGSRSDLFIAKQSTTSKVSVDLTNLKVGSHKVNIEYSQPLSSIEYSVNPTIATVNIYPKVSETKTLTTDILNQDSLDEKLIINNVTPEIDEVVIKGTDDAGADNSLTKVASVKALVDAEKLSANETGTTSLSDVPLRAYDKNGKIVDVEIVPNKINVDVDIESPSKQVPIRVIPVGDIEFGKAISSINMSDSEATVYASEEILDDLEYIPVEVDVSGIEENKDYKLDLTKPKGVRSMSVNNITLSFTLGTATDKDIENVNIDVRNLDDRYSVQGISQNDIKVTVNAQGVNSVLNNITAEDITAYIDLRDYEPGEHEVEVEVEGTDSRVTYVSKTKKVKIRIVEK